MSHAWGYVDIRMAIDPRTPRIGVCVLDIMPGRSRTTMDPCIPTITGRTTSGFHRRDRHCVHQAGGPLEGLCSAASQSHSAQ